MRGAALHGDVARPQRGLVGVEHEHDLAFEHDAVVDRLRAVHRGDDAGHSLIRILVPFGAGGTVSALSVGPGSAAQIGAGIASVPQTS